jgi:hypothetical protein
MRYLEFRHGRASIAIGLLVVARLANAQAPVDASTYAPLLARLQAHDTTLDFTRLRLAYAASAAYAPDPHSPTDDSLRPVSARGDYARLRVLADSVLAQYPLEIRPRVLRAYAAAQLGDTATANSDRLIAARLVRSIVESGDGTEQRPYVVISVAEEYALMNMLGHQRTGTQSDGPCGTHECDIIETRDRTGQARTLYFNIDLPQAYLTRLFHAK